MAKKTTHCCQACDVEFTVKHGAHEDLYPVAFCPFCGEEIEQEESYEFREED